MLVPSRTGLLDRPVRLDAALRVREYAPDAHVLDIGSAAFEIYEDAGGRWRWRLRHRNIMADSGEGYTVGQRL